MTEVDKMGHSPMKIENQTYIYLFFYLYWKEYKDNMINFFNLFLACKKNIGHILDCDPTLKGLDKGHKVTTLLGLKLDLANTQSSQPIC